MPSFTYVARDRGGKQVSGLLAGADERAVREQLRRKDLFVTTITEQRQVNGRANAGAKKKVKLGDMVIMSRQLATLVHAGLPLVECLYILAGQATNLALKATPTEVRSENLSGSNCSAALWR